MRIGFCIHCFIYLVNYSNTFLIQNCKTPTGSNNLVHFYISSPQKNRILYKLSTTNYLFHKNREIIVKPNRKKHEKYNGFDMRNNMSDIDRQTVNNVYQYMQKLQLVKKLQANDIDIQTKLALIEISHTNIESSNITKGGLYKFWDFPDM
jgi:light-regulated signal transduction histidine kinase (bacteriophytochrome)